jgi:hypothetical protein
MQVRLKLDGGAGLVRVENAIPGDCPEPTAFGHMRWTAKCLN